MADTIRLTDAQPESVAIVGAGPLMNFRDLSARWEWGSDG
jgi:hypothetical protein